MLYPIELWVHPQILDFTFLLPDAQEIFQRTGTGHAHSLFQIGAKTTAS
jgi:hypothetical protein